MAWRNTQTSTRYTYSTLRTKHGSKMDVNKVERLKALQRGTLHIVLNYTDSG